MSNPTPREQAIRQQIEQLHEVKAWWTHWRRSLDRGAFTHSDGIKFLRRLDEMETALLDQLRKEVK